MRLLSTVFGFLLRKVGLFVAMLVSLFLVVVVTSVLIPPVKEAFADQDRLDDVVHDRQRLARALDELMTSQIEPWTEQAESEVVAGRQRLVEKRADLKDAQGSVCNRLEKVGAAIAPGNFCDVADQAVEDLDAAVTTAERELDEAERTRAILADPELTPAEKFDKLGDDGVTSDEERRVATAEADLAQKQSEEDSLRKAQASWAGWLVRLWSKSWKWLAVIALAVLFLPLILRTIAYFVLMPLVRRAHKPFRLADGSEDAAAWLRTSPAERTLTIELGPGERLSARSAHVRPVQGKVRSQLLYRWRSPFISFAAGLVGLSRVEGERDGTKATLASPDDPDSYLMRIDFERHPGLVIRPTHVVGVIGSPDLQTRWRWGIHALATWQVRYIMFTGTGSLLVEGCGDVQADVPGQSSTRIEQQLTMGFDSRLAVGVNRTENFWQYLWGRTSVVNDEFAGDHAYFWQKSNTARSNGPIERTFDFFFSALGKVLGF